jgi:hypothetical protein
MQAEHTLRATLIQLQRVLSELSPDQYGSPLHVLGNASIGQHTRHIIEFFQTLNNGYRTGIINYDNRKRDHLLETNRDLALEELSTILENTGKADKEMLLISSYPDETVSKEDAVKSTYYREIMFNLEHTIHHMALIRIGIHESTNLFVPAEFGVAPATTQYRRSLQS